MTNSPPSSHHVGRACEKSPDPNSAARSVRVVLVDDHPITRHGLRILLGQQGRVEVCGETDSADAAERLVGELQPDIAIVDVSLRRANGLELTKLLRATTPAVAVLVVSMHDEAHYAEQALQAGAMGYVMKQDASEHIATAIAQLLRGEIYLSARMRQKMFRRYVNTSGENPVFTIDALSDREKQVFAAIGDGFSTRQIAEQLGLSTKTIDTYREHLKIKLALRSGEELLRHAVQWGNALNRRQGGALRSRPPAPSWAVNQPGTVGYKDPRNQPAAFA